MPLGTIPWAEIKVLYEGSDIIPAMTSLELERKYAGCVTRQAIDKRASREGWTNCKPLSPTTRAATLLKDVKLGETALMATPERLKGIIGDYAMGATDSIVAAKNGIHPDTLRRWIDTDENFSSAVSAARGVRALHRLGKVEEASDRGDWKATAWLMGKDVLTRAEFGEDQAKPSLAIQININRGSDEIVTVDAT